MQAREATVQQLLTGTRVFLVPLFQRRYQWSSKQWGELWDDVVDQYDHPDVVEGALPPGQGHFLGSVVLHPAPGPASTVSRFLVVDGQQRLTTLLSLIAAIRDFRSAEDSAWDTGAYTNQYLTNQYNSEHPDRLVPTVFDREGYVRTIRDGEPTGAIGQSYVWFLRALKGFREERDAVDFERLERAMLLRLLVVDISTSPADNVNNIFNTVNSKGLNLDPIDLIRNHIFMQLTPARAEAAHQRYWLPLEERLSSGDRKRGVSLQRFAWAYLVRYDAKATQKELFASFEKRMNGLTKGRSGDALEQAVEEELAQLERASRLFLMIDRPHSSAADSLPAPVRDALADLKAWGGETHLPVSLEVLWQLDHDAASADSAAQALGSILSFMIRRALCGVPTNNLNRIFSGLPSGIDRSVDVARAVSSYLAVGQRYWPSDTEVRQKIATTPIFISAKSAQVQFLLARIERYLQPDEPVDTDSLAIEHIMPFILTDEWRRYLREHGNEPDVTQTRVHTLGNLTLSGSPDLDSQGFDKKVRVFGSSNLRMNRQIAEVSEWTESSIVERGESLADAVIDLYPRVASAPEGQDEPGHADEQLDLGEVLLAVPAGSWTTLSDLTQLFASTEDELVSGLLELPDLLLAQVLTEDARVPDWIPDSRRALIEAQRESAGTDSAAGWTADQEPRRVTASELADLVSGEDREVSTVA